MAENLKPIIAGDRVHRPLFDYHVTEEDWQTARDELGETPETRRRCLKQLKQMLAEQNEFVPQTDDNYLLRFLRSRKFDVERAYKLMKEHYKLRARHPGLFPAPSKLKHVFEADMYNYFPYRDHHGRAVYFVRASNWDTSKVPFYDFNGTGTLVSEYVLDNPVTQINGYVALWDFKGFNLSRFAVFCHPRNMWIFKNQIQESVPGRFKAAYWVNCHPLAYKCWNVFKQLFKEKFRNRIILMGSNWSELHQYLDPSILPKEFGGHLEKMSADHLVNRIMEDEKDIIYSRSFGYPTRKS